MKKPTKSKKPTMASLLEKIERLEAEIEALKASPRETHNHYHTHHAPVVAPSAPAGPGRVWPWPAYPWNRPLWCGSGTTAPDPRNTLSISDFSITNFELEDGK